MATMAQSVREGRREGVVVRRAARVTRFGLFGSQTQTIWRYLDQFGIAENLNYLEINLEKFPPGPR